MRAPSLLAVLGVAFAILRGSSCFAGAMAVPVAGCDTLSTDPVRIVHHCIIFAAHHGCTIRVSSGSFMGSPVVPLLGCVGSPDAPCSFDSLSGVATFSLSPLCLDCCD